MPTSRNSAARLTATLKFADGVIIENNDVDPSIIEYAKSLGRPILDPVEGDDFNEIYNAFYRKIAEESNN